MGVVGHRVDLGEHLGLGQTHARLGLINALGDFLDFQAVGHGAVLGLAGGNQGTNSNLSSLVCRIDGAVRRQAHESGQLTTRQHHATVGLDQALLGCGQTQLGAQQVVAAHGSCSVEGLRALDLGIDVLDGLLRHIGHAHGLQYAVVGLGHLEGDVAAGALALDLGHVHAQLAQGISFLDSPQRGEGLGQGGAHRPRPLVADVRERCGRREKAVQAAEVERQRLVPPLDSSIHVQPWPECAARALALGRGRVHFQVGAGDVRIALQGHINALGQGHGFSGRSPDCQQRQRQQCEGDLGGTHFLLAPALEFPDTPWKKKSRTRGARSARFPCSALATQPCKRPNTMPTSRRATSSGS